MFAESANRVASSYLLRGPSPLKPQRCDGHSGRDRHSRLLGREVASVDLRLVRDGEQERATPVLHGPACPRFPASLSAGRLDRRDTKRGLTLLMKCCRRGPADVTLVRGE